MKKIISTVLLLCLILHLTAACAGDGDANKNGGINPAENDAIGLGVQNETATENLFDPELPESDFGGYEFRILNVDKDSLWWSLAEIDAAEQNGEVVNDAIYMRNRNIEEKYNFIVNEIRMSSSAQDAALRNSVNSGTDDYDLVLPLTTGVPGHAQNNYLVDLYKVPYLNFDKLWWNNAITKNFSISNKLFFTASDFILTDDESAAILMYNKKIAENLGIDSAESLYKLTDEGKWTFDKFTQLCKDASADLNGNGKPDADDRFGIITVGWLSLALLGGFGETLVAKEANDLPYLSCKSERFLNSYIKMTEFMMQRNVVIREHTDLTGSTDELYANDLALFCGEVLSCVRIFKDMGSDFGVLPMPKLDEYQDKYHTYTLISTCVAVPVTYTNLDRTGIILEALTAESRRLVVPAYYEIALGAKYLRDEGSLRMLDIILENKIYDIGNSDVMFKWGGLSNAVMNQSAKGEANLASVIEKQEEKTLADIQKTIQAYDEIG